MTPEIIQRAQEGDLNAMKVIYDHTVAMVYYLALGVTGNPSDADDATQETFLRAFQNLKGFKAQSELKTWIYRIALNTSLNVKTRLDRKNNQQIPIEEMHHLADSDLGPEKKLEMTQTKATVHKWLDQIAEDWRNVLMLREIQQLDYKEISDILEIPINTVRSRLFRARAALLEIARKEENSHVL